MAQTTGADDASIDACDRDTAIIGQYLTRSVTWTAGPPTVTSPRWKLVVERKGMGLQAARFDSQRRVKL